MPKPNFPQQKRLSSLLVQFSILLAFYTSNIVGIVYFKLFQKIQITFDLGKNLICSMFNLDFGLFLVGAFDTKRTL